MLIFLCLFPLSSINENKTQVTENYRLFQNYPNPFNPVTRINYEIKYPESHVKLICYDNLGNEITTLLDETRRAGSYEVTLNGDNFSSGVYYYKIFIQSLDKQN